MPTIWEDTVRGLIWLIATLAALVIWFAIMVVVLLFLVVR